jgi:hypothetical protein
MWAWLQLILYSLLASRSYFTCQYFVIHVVSIISRSVILSLIMLTMMSTSLIIAPESTRISTTGLLNQTLGRCVRNTSSSRFIPLACHNHLNLFGYSSNRPPTKSIKKAPAALLQAQITGFIFREPNQPKKSGIKAMPVIKKK